jgi:hypothetical protein
LQISKPAVVYRILMKKRGIFFAYRNKFKKIKLQVRQPSLKKAILYFLVIVMVKNYEKIAEKAFKASSAAI